MSASRSESQYPFAAVLAAYLLLLNAGGTCIAEEVHVDAGKLIARLNADWESQKNFGRPLRVSILRTNRTVPDDLVYSPDQVETLLARVVKLRNQKEPETFQATLKEMIIKFDPSLRGQPAQWLPIDLLMDGENRRIETLTRFGPELEVELANLNIRRRVGAPKRVDIAWPRRGVRVMRLSDLIYLPNIAGLPERELQVKQANKRTTVSSEHHFLLIDDEASFVHKHTTEGPEPEPGSRRGRSGRGVFQYAPVEVTNGFVLPRYRFDFRYRDGRLQSFSIIQLVKAEVVEGELPDDAFVVSAPAGASIVDYRVRPPARTELKGAVKDVAKLGF